MRPLSGFAPGAVSSLLVTVVSFSIGAS
jgi:hypothetical protein